MRNKVEVFRLGFNIQRIAETAAQPGLNCQRAFVRGRRNGGNFPRKRVNRFFEMVGQRCISIDNPVIPAVFQRRTDFNQGAQSGIAGVEDRRGYAVSITGFQVARHEQFGRTGKVGDQITAGDQFTYALGNKKGGSAVTEHPHRDCHRIAQPIADGLLGQILVKKGDPLRCQPGRLPQVPSSPGGVLPAAARVFIEDHAAEINSPRGGDLHNRSVIRVWLSAQLVLPLRVITFGRKREHIAGFRKEEPVQNSLAQLVRFLTKRIGIQASGSQQKSAGNQQGGNRQQRKQGSFRKTVGHQQEQQRQQRRKKPGDHISRS